MVFLAGLLGALSEDSQLKSLSPGTAKLAVVEIKGVITSNGGTDVVSGIAGASADEITESLERVCERSDISAVFLEIDSPGGELTASERVKYAVDDCNKPVLVYIESVGASGAYLSALPADKIVSYETSIVGSIGVISEYLEFSEFLEDYGVKQVKLFRGRFKGVGDPFSESSEEDLNYILGPILDQAYEGFKADVVSYRGGKLAYTAEPLLSDEIANGAPFTGRKALELGLVDELVTSEKQAKLKAAQLAGFEDYAEVITKKKKGWIEGLLESFSEDLSTSLLKGFKPLQARPSFS